MRQLSVFNGFINGEHFSDVQSYNARMNELVAAGHTDIEAEAATSIKFIDDEDIEVPTMPVREENFDMYPYINDDDPYLDNLVTIDLNENDARYNKMLHFLSNTKNNIFDWLNDTNIRTTVKKHYINNIAGIIERIKQDSKNNNTCINVVESKRAKLVNDIEQLKAQYDVLLEGNEKEHNVLCSATRVIDALLDFYKEIQAEGLNAITNAEQNAERTRHNATMCVCREPVHPDNCTCGTCDNTCNVAVEEIQPQQVGDITNWYNRILEHCGLR